MAALTRTSNEQQGPSGPLSGKQGPSGPLSGKQGPSGPLSGKQGPSGPLSGKQGPSGPLSGKQGPSGPLSGKQGPSGPLSGKRVEAAGGVVWRRSRGGLEVLLVHRPRYDDWTLPKGKLNAGEDHPSAALREVEEETGLRCTLGAELAPSAYVDGRGRPKVVRWWAMTPDTGAFVPGPEVDEAGWLPVPDAAVRLSYPRDREVLRSFTSQPGTAAVLLVRHGDAGDRDRWEGDDRLRPLSARGGRQARALVGQLAGYGTVRVISSAYVRCVQTVEPLAAARGLATETSPALAEGAGRDAVCDLLDQVAGTAVVLCTHGDVADEALHALGRLDGPCAKGSTWVLEPDDGKLVAARYLRPPA